MRRSLRIIPGLAFVIFLSFAIIGPILTTLDVADYFSRREAWTYLAKVLVFPSQYGLPGYSQIIHFRPSLMGRCGRYESRSPSTARLAFSA
jgi:peptidoglycan/LPS O-acetylase OafA/YrhL